MQLTPIEPVASEGSLLRTILILGEIDRAEMCPLVTWLKEHVNSARHWVHVHDATSVVGEFAPDEFPDLIVVLQSWSNEFSAREVNSLLAFAPLARIVVCYGAWCESDGRNQNIWPLSVRVPVWAAQSRIEREWQLIQSPGERPPLPWSASREEVFAADHPPIMRQHDQQMILVDSPDSAYRQYLGERLVEAGHAVVREAPTVLMIDVDPWGPSRFAALRALRDQYPRATVLALTNLVQPPLVEELGCLGIDTVLPKLGARW